MPGKRVTAPVWQGPGGTRRLARSREAGLGRMGGPYAAGPGCSCLCPGCGHTIVNVPGQVCSARICPKCGATMTKG